MLKKKRRRIGVFGNEHLTSLILNMIKASEKSDRWEAIPIGPSDELEKRCSEGSCSAKIKKYAHYALQCRSLDVVCIVYIGRRARFLARIAKIFGAKVVFFWIGSDVWSLMKGAYSERFLNSIRNSGLHLADGDNLVEELAQYEITSISSFITASIDFSMASMPEEHAVLINIPDSRTDFYNLETTMRVINAFPDLRFVVIRSNSPELYPGDNIDFFGAVPYEDMDKVYEQVSIILRYPMHDSVSLTSIEALAKGKYIISKTYFPTAFQVSSFEEICEALQRLIESPPEQNVKGHQLAVELFSLKNVGDQLLGNIETWLEG